MHALDDAVVQALRRGDPHAQRLDDPVQPLAIGGDEADARAKAGNVAESLDIAIV